MTQVLKQEIIRKLIHFLGFLFLPLLLWKRPWALLLLVSFLVFYLLIEVLLKKGIRLPFLTSLIQHAKRKEETGRLSKGPILMALGALVAIYGFGDKAAALGLGQLFVADAIACLVGMKWGKAPLPYNPQKTWLGSFAFFCSAFLVGLFLISWPKALGLAFVGMILESFPITDWDNFTIPTGVAAVAFLMGIS